MSGAVTDSPLAQETDLVGVLCCDWIIDLGPDGGDLGEQIIAEGTPEEVAQVETSYTGYYLKHVLEQHPPCNH